MSLQTHVCGLATHKQSQLVMHNLHHQLLGLHGGEHILSQCLLLYGVGEVLGHLIVHVRVQERTAHVLKCLRYVDFRYLAFALQNLEGAFKAFA